MDPIKPTAADALRDSAAVISGLIPFAPFSIRKPLSNLVDSLDIWVSSVEMRLSRIEGVKSWVGPMSVPAETTDEENRERELRRLALIARGNCEDCEG